MNEVHNRNSGKKSFLLLAGLAVTFLAAYLLVQWPEAFPRSEAGGNAMDGGKEETAMPRVPGKPRMDLVKHRATETATFALG